MTHGKGWIPDLPDARDHVFGMRAAGVLPRHVDLRETTWMPDVYQQGTLGSCTANGVGACLQYDRRKLGFTPDFVPSRLQIYYDEREIEGSVAFDGGAQIRDGIKVVAKNGAAPEAMWPYIPSKFAVKPPAAVYTEAAKHQIVQYARVEQSASALKACLAQFLPVVFGFSIYQSFESDYVAQTGMVPMPDFSTESIVGGHCVVIVGYTSRSRFIIRNSWGDEWGDGGYAYFPEMYVTSPQLSADFWTISTTES